MRAALTLVALACSLAAWRGAAAQVVRGTVTERSTGAPLTGIVLELAAADGGGRVAAVLTGGDGGFALRAPAPGRYVVTAKRIGVRRWASAPLELRDGETRTLDVVLDALDYRLPEVVVQAQTPCATDPSQRMRVAALWEEARTALDAAQLSLRDRLFTADVVRYVRELEPRSGRVLNETRSEVRGVVASPFRSAPAESLSAHGYWREQPGGGALYHGPDTDVLLSAAFLRDHCFRVVQGERERAGLTGIAFSPVAGRVVPDIVGTLWLDARGFELRLVEFRYDRVREGVDGSAVGGEVHFARLPNGAWIVRRWFLRVPVLGRPVQPLSTEGSAPWVLVRPTMVGLSEEGGVVTTDALRPPVRPGRIAGVVSDSTGRRALAGAVVRLAGTPRAAVADAEGRFAFDSVPPGSHTLVASAAWYDSLGLAAADAAVSLGDGERRTVALRAHDGRLVTTRLCRGAGAPYGRGTLHLVVRDSASGAPAGQVSVSVTWMSTLRRPAGADSVPATVEAVTDDRGMVSLCELPAGRELTVRIVHSTGAAPTARTVMIGNREVRHVEVRVVTRDS